MDSQMAKLDETSGRAIAGWVSVRIVLFGIGGVVSGLVSCRVITFGDFQEILWIWVSAPGLIFGLFWLATAWIPSALSVRDNVRRSIAWTLAFLAGTTLSFVGAYYAAFYLATNLDHSFVREFSLGISGFLAAIPGSLGLACCWSFLFPAVDSWFAKSVLTALGSILGATLLFWKLDEPDFRTLYLFFAIWQGGMAMALAAIDSAWRIGRLKEA